MTTQKSTNLIDEPKNTELEQWISQAWVHHVNKEYSQSESLFRQALKAYPDSEEAAYGLGLSLKQSNHPQEAIQSFQTALKLLENSTTKEDSARWAMLRHLSNAHISMLSA